MMMLKRKIHEGVSDLFLSLGQTDSFAIIVTDGVTTMTVTKRTTTKKITKIFPIKS